jgi:hypothetical protein
MNTRFPSDRRASWRDRFLAISRQFESAGERAQAFAGSAGLRARPRLSAQGPIRRLRASA